MILVNFHTSLAAWSHRKNCDDEGTKTDIYVQVKPNIVTEV